MNDYDRYKRCLEEGVELNYGKLTLVDLRNYRHSAINQGRRYQVHCEDSKYPWSMIYDELGPAICKFMEIKKKVRRYVR